MVKCGCGRYKVPSCRYGSEKNPSFSAYHACPKCEGWRCGIEIQPDWWDKIFLGNDLKEAGNE